MQEVTYGTKDVEPLKALVGEQWERLTKVWEPATQRLQGHTVWHVNATPTGGGVAEMLQSVLPMWREMGIETRWLVLEGDPDFFAITKRLHNRLHGSDGDGGDLGPEQTAAYDKTLARNAEDLRRFVQPGDFVVLHDPQTAGLIPVAKEIGASVVWRSHIGRDEPNDNTANGWKFLESYLGDAERVIVSRPAYRPPSVDEDRTVIITPCIDPFTPKNVDIAAATATEVLVRAGLLEAHPAADGETQRDESAGAPTFTRVDGATGTVRVHDDALAAGTKLPVDARVIMQVSRWDRLKDMPGVMKGFVDNVTAQDAHLVLCGPAVEGVTDDPEGAEVFAECREAHAQLDEKDRARVHLFCIPMDDVQENAYIVNALQRHAFAVVQKSFFEGFGLTVTEAMWKARPVIASRVGGIQDQITDGQDGLLVDDPKDLAQYGAALERVLNEQGLAEHLGTAARETVKSRFLANSSMQAYAELMLEVLPKG